MTTNNNNNSYVAGFKVNYSSDTDNSSNSVRSSNASLLTSIQLIDLKNINNDNGKLKENKYGYAEKTADSGYFKRLKFSTTSLLKRNKNSNTLVKPQDEKCSEELSSKTDSIQDKKIHNLNYRKLSILKPSDGHFFSFLKSKKEIKSQSNKNNDTSVSKTEYEFLDKMGISERCRISIECKNNSISIEGHRKCS